jgi:hypothetical protein
MATSIYKKISQSDKRQLRSVSLTAEEKSAITIINEKFIQFFKNKHLS